ncbi:hypothetical protein CI109_104424 [Kwoniella shandongensis]|uniref:Uncharacterized protein n=1 Tax=Kwoniella shandongensis TaxID=1734106 RepID=A0A5M6BWV2_9TREE|nr:uncharacterized protein CI109_004178 [Kwoniella shandongensis]KAA5527366.1 hypothetical protein CI109_004178 [Kwoniella shandongensis]
MPSKLQWAYREFGLSSVRDTGSDAFLVILARSSRMFAYGANSIFIPLFFSSLHFSDFRIGLFMSLTLAGDVLLTLALTLVADRVGRRRSLLFGSFLMVCSGITFMISEHYWVLLLAAIVGVISSSGGDFGPFRAIEESILSQITTLESRSNVLSWYVTTASFGSAIGTEIAGRTIHALKGSAGWTEVDAYHAIFGLYVVFGIVNMGCALFLSERTELEDPTKEGEDGILLESVEEEETDQKDTPKPSRLAQLSPKTRSVMFKLWPLLAVDSMADGMVNYSLTAYYMTEKFAMTAATLGDITSISYFLAAISTIFAGPLANRIGLINTMVFTHVPSSSAVLLFPASSSLVLTITLFFIRTGLNNMDQAPRAAFIAAVVPASERTAVNGITSMLRTLASTLGPTLTGGLAEHKHFGVAFVAAGTLRLAYDFGLWALLGSVKIEE